MTCKLHPKFIPNEASKGIKILKDLAVEINQKQNSFEPKLKDINSEFQNSIMK